jgi:hypothetical protein
MVFGNIDLKSGGSTPGSPFSMIHVYIPEAKSTQIQTTMESEKKLREGLYEPVAVYFAENDAIFSFDDMEEILDSVVKHLDDLIPNYMY